MPPVLFFNAPRDCYRDVIVDADEIYVTRAPVHGRERCIQRPPGVYDVAEVLREKVPDSHRKPSMVVCQWDCEGQCAPSNLKGVDCPKVLLVGDTHHTPQPLQRAIKLALAEPWDLVVLEFNGRHCHWFTEAGVKCPVVYIPCFTISPIDIPPPVKRTRGVTFCGNVGRDHVYRRHVLNTLAQRGVKVEVHSGVTPQQAATIYNESRVSLNISLNGDFNLRNYEAIAAGGFLMTNNYMGGNHGLGWDDVDDLIDRLDVFGSEEESLARARECYRYFWETHSPAHKIAALHRAMAEKPSAPPVGLANPGNVWERIQIYEQVQQLVLEGRWRWDDMADLPKWRVA